MKVLHGQDASGPYVSFDGYRVPMAGLDMAQRVADSVRALSGVSMEALMKGALFDLVNVAHDVAQRQTTPADCARLSRAVEPFRHMVKPEKGENL